MRLRLSIAAAVALAASLGFLLGGRPGPEPVTAAAGPRADTLALSQHRFEDALALGRRAQRLSPATARNYGVIGDALVELGRYREGFRAYDRMAALKPGYSAYARVSHARELIGDVPGAIAAMRAGGARRRARAPQALAWARLQRRQALLRRGPARARRAPSTAPRSPPIPATRRRSTGSPASQPPAADLARAVALERAAVERRPLPELVAFLGDLYRAQGRTALAREQYALVARDPPPPGRQGQPGRPGDRTLRRRPRPPPRVGARARPPRAARAPERAGRRRPRRGRSHARADAAKRCATRSARSGSARSTRPRSSTAAMIERCLGRDAEARRWFRRALATNPHFSLLWSPVARRLAR